jgi:hypothetical protein
LAGASLGAFAGSLILSTRRVLILSRMPLMNAPEFEVEKRLPISIASLIAT